MRPSRLSILACGLVMAVGPLGAAAAPAGPPIHLAAIFSTSGRYAPLGGPEKDAVLLAVEQINARGGVNGRPVDIEVLDDQGKPDVASQLATQEIGKGVVGIVGGTSTDCSAAIARVANDAKIPEFYTTPSSEVWDTRAGVAKYVFETNPNNAIEAPALLDFAAKKLGAKKIAVIHDENAYGAEGARIVAGLAKEHGVEIVTDQSYPGASTDFTAQLVAIKNSGADTVVLWGAAAAPPLIVRGIRQLGLKVNVIGSNGIVSNLFLKIAGTAGDGVYSDTNIDYTHPTATQKPFLNAYHAKYKARPANFAAYAYDGVALLAYAIRTSKQTTGDAIVGALESMKPLPLITGTYHFTPKDHNGLSPADVHLAVDKNQIWFNLD
ncbi:MAG TPA: ABC transporter substrate-binding protein [Candidatus Sulfotelmatobacter sp.]|nr:ABC transporter substrate-binding protein [Candidatus Sulfotelmatobacter sp.]